MKNTINLLPKQTPAEKAAIKRSRITWIATFGLLIFLVGVWGVLFSYLQALKLVGNSLNDKISQKEQAIVAAASVENAYRDIYNKTKAAQMLFIKRDQFTGNLAKYKNFTNAAITLRDVSLDSQQITVTVKGADIGSITAYMMSLEDENKRQGVFDSLTLSQTTLDKVNGYTVTIEGVFANGN